MDPGRELNLFVQYIQMYVKQTLFQDEHELYETKITL